MKETKNVIALPVQKANMTVSETLDYASHIEWKELMVMGIDADNQRYTIHSGLKRKEALWFLEQERMRVLGFEADY